MVDACREHMLRSSPMVFAAYLRPLDAGGRCGGRRTGRGREERSDEGRGHREGREEKRRQKNVEMVVSQRDFDEFSVRAFSDD